MGSFIAYKMTHDTGFAPYYLVIAEIVTVLEPKNCARGKAKLGSADDS